MQFPSQRKLKKSRVQNVVIQLERYHCDKHHSFQLADVRDPDGLD